MNYFSQPHVMGKMVWCCKLNRLRSEANNNYRYLASWCKKEIVGGNIKVIFQGEGVYRQHGINLLGNSHFFYLPADGIPQPIQQGQADNYLSTGALGEPAPEIGI